MLSGPEWATFSSKQATFTFDAPLVDFLDGDLKLGAYTIDMSFNVKNSGSYAGSFLGSEVLGGDSSQFY